MIYSVSRSLLVVAAVLTSPTGAQTQPPAVAEMEAVYDFYLGGIRVGEMAVSADFDDERYNAKSTLLTTGIIGFFYKLSFKAKVDGKLGAEGLSPERYISDTSSPKRDQSIMISFEDKAPVSSKVEPVRKVRPWSIDARDQNGVTDPLSALLTAFSPAPADVVCEQRIDVFDGRRRYALEIGERQIENARIRCDALYVRLAGFKPKWMGKNATRPFTVYLEERDDGLFEVVRAVIDTPYGAAILRLQK